ncbi:DUF2059 domain-containing protein [Sporocytophaga myxococcoides]|uniref:DUF2059 domain-containing protein n=1 Tax=Sporocytophaga myxococcoides TaxID=153721 RepID=UPI000421C24E|nr:DUF2059 domain-containing protein [Sporocytophaga myxococcoides]
MKKGVIVFILFFGFSFVSVGQGKKADLKKLFNLIQTEKMIDGTMNNLVSAIKQQTSGQIQGADSKEKFDKYIEFVMNEAKELSKKLVNVEMIEIYDKHFTEKEVKDLIAFYESPTGQKFIEKTPEITKDMMNVMMSKYMSDFQERIKKKLEELK